MTEPASPSPAPSPIVALAQRQLDAYNAHDLDAFCACYHPEVVMMEGEEVSCTGISDFRARYEAMFAKGAAGEGPFGATVPARLHLGEHCVDDERWWRVDPESGERREGQILVRYRLRDGLIGRVQFLGD